MTREEMLDLLKQFDLDTIEKIANWLWFNKIHLYAVFNWNKPFWPIQQRNMLNKLFWYKKYYLIELQKKYSRIKHIDIMKYTDFKIWLK